MKPVLTIKSYARLCTLLLILPCSRQIQAQHLTPAGQAPAAAVSRVFTLDETLDILYLEGGDSRKEFHWDPFFRDGSFTIGGHYGAFSAALSAGQTGFLMLDNRDIYTIPQPYLDRGELVFSELFVNTAREAFARSIMEDSAHYRIAAIMIDPGHGGKDSGGTGEHIINGKQTKVIEKDIVLDISKQLRDMLVSTFPDKRVLMTRDSDIFYKLEERPLIANTVPIRKNEAIIYVSIHANASPSKEARGFEVFRLSQNTRRTVLDASDYSDDSPVLRDIMNSIMEEDLMQESTRLARSILNAFDTAIGGSTPNRGLKEDSFVVVRHSRMPAVLVELPFVTNKDDALLLTSDTHLRKMAEAVYKGIVDFVGAFDRSGGFIAAP